MSSGFSFTKFVISLTTRVYYSSDLYLRRSSNQLSQRVTTVVSESKVGREQMVNIVLHQGESENSNDGLINPVVWNKGKFLSLSDLRERGVSEFVQTEVLSNQVSRITGFYLVSAPHLYYNLLQTM